MTAAQRALVLRCVELHHDLMAEQLYATGHKMHEVVQQIGWELAEDVLGVSKMREAEQKRAPRR